MRRVQINGRTPASTLVGRRAFLMKTKNRYYLNLWEYCKTVIIR